MKADRSTCGLIYTQRLYRVASNNCCKTNCIPLQATNQFCLVYKVTCCGQTLVSCFVCGPDTRRLLCLWSCFGCAFRPVHRIYGKCLSWRTYRPLILWNITVENVNADDDGAIFVGVHSIGDLGDERKRLSLQHRHINKSAVHQSLVFQNKKKPVELI